MFEVRLIRFPTERAGWSLTKLTPGCDSTASVIRTRLVELMSGRKDRMSCSVTAPLACGGGRIIAAGQLGIQRAKSSCRETNRREILEN